MKSGGIPIITGFQGINLENRITTLGRGGTDATAIMLAKFFNADSCEIYTDVDGVYTTDPRNIKSKKNQIKFLMTRCLKWLRLAQKLCNHSASRCKIKQIIPQLNLHLDKKGKELLITKKKKHLVQIITGVSFI